MDRLKTGFIVILLTATVGANAQETHSLIPRSSGKAWVQIVPEAGTPDWQARAVQDTVEQTLSGLDRIIVTEATGTLDFISARERGVDILIRGTLSQNLLKVQVKETWTGSMILRDRIELDHTRGLIDFRHRIFRWVKPFVEIGGLLDQHWTESQGKGVPHPPRLDFHILFVVLAGIPLFFLFWIPRALTAYLARKRKLVFQTPHRAQVVGHFMSFATPATWFVLAAWQIIGPSVPLQGFLAGSEWALVGVALFRFAWPSLRGMDRLNYFTIFPLVRNWLSVAAIKSTIFFLAVLPFAVCGWTCGNLLGATDFASSGLIVPFFILVALIWYLFWCAYLTRILDTILIEGQASAANPWNDEIVKYFRGYLNRLEIPLDETLLTKILFLPSSEERVMSYGGGLERPRTVLGSKILVDSMGPLPERHVLDESGPSFADFRTGMLIPVRKKSKNDVRNRFSEPAGSIFSVVARLFKKRTEPQFETSPVGRKFNSHNATLLGYVVPTPPEETVPLIANNREDFEVLASLLTEHYAQFAKEQEQIDFDDTDPTDKDYLLGALLREYGFVENNDHLILTFVAVAEYFDFALPKPMARAAVFVRRALERIYLRRSDFLADSFAALNQGRNHLAQYLYSRLPEHEIPPTVRADATTLYSVSRQIFGAIETTPDSPLKRRLVWVSEFFYGSIVDASPSWRRTLAKSALLLSIFGITAAYAMQSIRYHNVYLARMERMKAKIDESQAVNESPGFVVKNG